MKAILSGICGLAVFLCARLWLEGVLADTPSWPLLMGGVAIGAACLGLWDLIESRRKP